jgi:type II secretory pathway pseudopilin PulG
MKHLAKNVSGDTIVEVLIAIVILSLILTGAYVTSNDSLRNIRDAQERIQALGIAQSQAEDLRAESNDVFIPSGNNLSYLSPPTSFCFDKNNNFTPFPVSSPVGTCQFQNIPYTVHIYGLGALSAPATTVTFKIEVTWPSISANTSIDHMDIYYRVGT